MTINFKNHIKDTCWAELENNEIQMDSEFNLVNQDNKCNQCLKLFGEDIKNLYNNIDKDSAILNEKLSDYYNLLLKAYSFDYMTDPTLDNKHKIQKLNECYNKVKSGTCIKKNNKQYNYFNIDYKNNLELINNIFN